MWRMYFLLYLKGCTCCVVAFMHCKIVTKKFYDDLFFAGFAPRVLKRTTQTALVWTLYEELVPGLTKALTLATGLVMLNIKEREDSQQHRPQADRAVPSSSTSDQSTQSVKQSSSTASSSSSDRSSSSDSSN